MTDRSTAFLDSCFSGDSAGGMLTGETSRIAIKRRPAEVPSRPTVITAARGTPVASWAHDSKHGLSTEHLLGALYGAADAGEFGDGANELFSTDQCDDEVVFVKGEPKSGQLDVIIEPYSDDKHVALLR